MAANPETSETTEKWRPGLYMLNEVPNASLNDVKEEKAARPPAPDAVINELTAQCFICNKQLTESPTPNVGTLTREDIFPTWLCEKFQLKNDFIDYPNNTSKKYPKILIPCCNLCNNEWMSQVEGRISKAVKAANEYSEFIKLNRSDVSLWTGKILYGLLMTRIAPWNFNVNSPLPQELSSSALDDIWLLRKLLAGFRQRVIINAPDYPISILTFQLKSGSTPRLNWNFRDTPRWPTAIAMRMGSVGLIVAFEDFGYLRRWYNGELAGLLSGKTLHPVQFSEVVARALYTGGLCCHDYKYTLIEGTNDCYMSLTPLPKQAYEENPQALGALVTKLTGLNELSVVVDGKVPSILVNKRGVFQDIPFEENVKYPM
jgi:hypothetical protein